MISERESKRERVPDEEEFFWRDLFSANVAKKRSWDAELTRADGSTMYLFATVALGTPLWACPSMRLFFVDPLRAHSRHFILPDDVQRMREEGRNVEAVHLTVRGRKRRALLIQAEWEEPFGDRLPWYRMANARVEQLYEEGGWEIVGYWVDPIAPPDLSTIDAAAVLRALGRQHGKFAIMDASEARVEKLEAFGTGVQGEFEVKFWLNGRPHGWVRPTPQSIFDNIPVSFRQHFSLRWTLVDGDPRAWLHSVLPTLALGKDAEPDDGWW